MQANTIFILSNFIELSKSIFRIPVYQRNYDWSEQNCKRLLSDIYNIIENQNNHFLGAIVHQPSDKNKLAGGRQIYTIIDGQQRLTTIMILLKALSDIAETEIREEIEHEYLYNSYCNEEEFKAKLKPVKSDNEQFNYLLNNSDEINKDSHFYLNYNVLKEGLSQWINKGITTRQILDALHRIEIVQIALDEKDDPQIIFESINSTGLDLTNSDLIRNFLLMNTIEQNMLYEKYWLPIEKKLKRGNDNKCINNFFMNYLAFKLKKPISDRKIYNTFIELYYENNYTQETMLEELKKYSSIYSDLVFENNNYSDSIENSLRGLRQLQQTTCFPFLIALFDDYKNEIITEDILDKTMKLILSYLVKRLVCGIPTNSLRGFFIYLYNRIFKVEKNKKKYYEAVNKFLFTINSSDAMPSEEKFEEQLKISEIYPNLALCKYILGDIENQDGKEIINVPDLTIEHLMPQSLNVNWNHINSEVHKQYLHTLGNLTITGYNSELSNRPFSEKKEIISKFSKAKILNEDVLTCDKWDVSTIKNRAERLANIVKNRHKIEEVKDDGIVYEWIKTLTASDYNEVTKRKLISFKFNGNTYYQKKFKLMLNDVIALLDTTDHSILPILAEKNMNGWISTDPEKLRKPWTYPQNPTIFIEQNLSSQSIISFINQLMDEYKFDKNNFSFDIILNEDEYEEDDEKGEFDVE